MSASKLAQLRAFAAELGLTPNSRARLPRASDWPDDRANADDSGDLATFLAHRPDRDAEWARHARSAARAR